MKAERHPSEIRALSQFQHVTASRGIGNGSSKVEACGVFCEFQIAAAGSGENFGFVMIHQGEDVGAVFQIRCERAGSDCLDEGADARLGVELCRVAKKAPALGAEFNNGSIFHSLWR